MVYKIVPKEGGVEHLRRLVNGRLLVEHWDEILLARPVRARWERIMTDRLPPPGAQPG